MIVFLKKFSYPFAPADNGGAIGSSIYTYSKYGKEIENIKSPYLGNSYSNLEIEKVLKYYANNQINCKTIF